MSAPGVVRFVAVFSAGLIAGILVGDRMGASFARPSLSRSSFVTFQQIQHAHFVRMMPILVGLAILSIGVWLVTIRSRVRSAEFVFLALAAVAFVSVSVITGTVNMPINGRLMAWDPASPPADAVVVWARWEQAHTVRTALAATGFALALTALAAARSQRAFDARTSSSWS